MISKWIGSGPTTETFEENLKVTKIQNTLFL